MIFIDPFFLFVFLPAAALIFHLVGRRFGATAKLSVIFAASILFYLPWGWFPTALLLASVLVNFVAGSALLRLPPAQRRTRIGVLVAGQIYNFGSLILFKYNVFPDSWPQAGADLGELAIPAGISFYTFHQAAFLADAYAREKHVVAYLSASDRPAKVGGAFARYAAFVTFFPQLVIGPITYLREFSSQITPAFGRVRYINFAIGLTLIAIGLFKKVVIADRLAVLVDPVFADAAQQQAVHPGAAWVAVAAYYAQLYFDFSGYSDIALGIARIFGIRYPINFFSPLKAVGIIDFYRRWHMSLTRVISRFLFTPLSLIGSRFAARRRWAAVPSKFIGLWLPLIINFEIIGLWHDAASTLVTFGLVHGLWYTVENEVRSSKRWKRWRKRTPDATRALWGRAIFLLFMPLTFALFRSESLPAAGYLARQLVGGDFAEPFSWVEAAVSLAPAFAIIYLMPNTIEFLRAYRPGIMTFANPSYGRALGGIRWRPNWRWALFSCVLVALSFYYLNEQPPFLYQGF